MVVPSFSCAEFLDARPLIAFLATDAPGFALGMVESPIAGRANPRVEVQNTAKIAGKAAAAQPYRIVL
jgi:hypothetical protein